MQNFYTNSFSIKADKEDNRIVEFIASKELADRDNEIVKIKGIDLKNYKANPLILWSHNRSDLPIGKAVKITKSGDTLKIKAQFATAEENPFADQVYRLVKGGYLNSTSIGFMPDWEKIEYDEKKNQRIFNKVELFEVSIVNVPANPGAIATGKSFVDKAFEDGVLTEEEVEVWESETKEDRTIKELEARIVALEKETQEVSSQEDSYFEEIFKELKSESGTKSPDTNSNDLDDLLEELKNPTER